MPLPAGLLRQISREEMANLPIGCYEGEVLVVETQQDLERAMQDLRQESAAGFDTETRPAFRPGESYLPALAQVATARAVYLFPLQRLDFSPEMAEILSSPALVKAGVGLADDLRQMKKMFAFEEAAVLDLGKAAQRHGARQTGVRNLAGLYLGMRIPKGTKTSNWAAPRLSPQQVAYAATDAWVCRELYLRFRELGMLP